jgi:hypothetical protein
MKNKKKNKAQRQAGRRLCKNIKNGQNRNCGFIVHKKETPIYASNMRVYISNASGQFTMDQHIDTSKLEQLKEQLSKKPGTIPSVKVEVKPTQEKDTPSAPATPTSPVKKKSYWWAIAGSIMGGGLLGFLLATRKKSA